LIPDDSLARRTLQSVFTFRTRLDLVHRVAELWRTTHNTALNTRDS